MTPDVTQASPDLVSWWLTKYGREAQQMEAAKESKRAADKRHQQWLKDTLRPLDREAAWWRSLIDGYCLAKLRAECGDRDMTDPKVWKHMTKRFKFPTGYIQARRVSESFTVTDPVKWQTWVLDQADAGEALVGLWERLSVWMGEDASTCATVNVPAPEWGDPRFRPVDDCQVVAVDTGEVVPGLGWVHAMIVLNAPHPEDAEHPAWVALPEGWDIDHAPDDWSPDTIE